MSYISPIEIHDDISERIDNYAQYIAGEVDRLVMREVHKVSCKVDEEELIKALRYDRGQYEKGYADGKRDAAYAIEALQAEVKRLEQERDELIGQMPEMTETADGWKWKWKPHWVSVGQPPKGNGTFAACCVYDGKIYWFKAIYLDGKWLREMDGVELPVNYWMEIPQPPQEVQDGTD